LVTRQTTNQAKVSSEDNHQLQEEQDYSVVVVDNQKADCLVKPRNQILAVEMKMLLQLNNQKLDYLAVLVIYSLEGSVNLEVELGLEVLQLMHPNQAVFLIKSQQKLQVYLANQVINLQLEIFLEFQAPQDLTSPLLHQLEAVCLALEMQN